MASDYDQITGRETPPEAVVRDALATGCRSIAYTYTEPTIYFEYALDTSRLARDKGLINVFVTNGYMSPECLDMTVPYVAAANVDLKSFQDSYYREQCKARLQPVLDSLRKMKDLGIWVEVTTLLVPGLNDSDQELRDIARFIRNLGPETPWHISRFYPTYRLTSVPPTPVESIRHARRIGLEEGLHYVYTGNLPGDEGEKTYCPGCSKLLINRRGYFISRNALSAGKCPECGWIVPGIGME
jgi:pyruvate formate lyase activating enzyme